MLNALNNVEILIDRAPSSHCIAFNKQPVFPVYTESEFQLLNNLVAHLGGVIRNVKGTPVDYKQGNGVVTALGVECLQAAEIYAHLTGRTCRLVADPTQQLNIRPHVLVTLWSNLNVDIMEQLYSVSDYESHIAPGIISSHSLEKLRERTLYNAALALFDGIGPAESVDIRPIEYAPESNLSNVTVLDCDSSLQSLQDALTKNFAQLCINTHSDGIDAFLRDELTLCSLLNKTDEKHWQSRPYCCETGICHRHKLPINQVRDYLMDPAKISARVLIWSACYGVLLDNSIYYPQSGLLGSILKENKVGAIITTWGVSLSNREVLDDLQQALSSCTPFGVAVKKLNQSSTAIKSGMRFCLFGDPDSFLPANTNSQLPIKNTDIQQSTNSEKNYEELTFLKAYLMSCLSRLPLGLEKYLQTALDAIQLYEYFYWHGAIVDASPNSPGEALRESVLDFIMHRGSALFHVWLAFASDMNSTEGDRCFSCAGPTSITRVRLRFPGASERELVRCSRCGVIRDAIAGSDLELQFEQDRFLLKGHLPVNHWRACLHLGCQNESESHAWLWPAHTDDSPARIFVPPRPWPKGPLRAAFILLEGTTIHITSLPLNSSEQKP